jgi:hypothetical protein
MKTVRATMKTSVAAGAALGCLSAFSENHGQAGMIVLDLFFFATGYVLVVGIPLMREFSIERKRRGIRAWMMVEKEDFQRFYFPVWRRMIGWFLGAIAGRMATGAIVWLTTVEI